jgi:hypothetical protein
VEYQKGVQNNQRGKPEKVGRLNSEKFKDALLLALKIKEEASSQGMHWACRLGNRVSLEPLEDHSPADSSVLDH